jgi:hypothetical protein
MFTGFFSVIEKLCNPALNQSWTPHVFGCEQGPQKTSSYYLRTMGREEQIEEREVLDSIFPDEIQGMWYFHGLRSCSEA